MNLKRIKSLCIFAFIAIIPGISSQASSNSNHYFDLTIEELMDIKVTTASKNEEKLFESASATYVITSEDIRRAGATSIPEALRLAPGLHVARIDSNKWAITARGFNRQFSNKLLVLFDGRSVYTPLFSGVYWDSQDYILEDIERIEVIRGPGASLWGANAVNGVINIITKKAKDTQGQYVSALAGNYDKHAFEYRYGDKTKNNAHYRVYAKSFEVDETKNLDGLGSNDQWQMNRVGFKMETDENKSDIYYIQGDIYSGVQDQIFFLPQESVTTLLKRDGDEDMQGGNIVVKLNREFDEDTHLDITSYFDYEKRYFPILKQSRSTFNIDAQYSFKANDSNSTMIGTEYRNIHDNLEKTTINSTSYLAYDPAVLTYEILSAFIQNKTELQPNKMFLTLGSKFDYNDFTGFEVQPTIRMSYLPSESHHFWSAVSRAVRTPTRGEDGISLIALSGYTAQVGSKQYDSEKLTAYELGYKFNNNRNLSFDVTAFYNDYSDLRTQQLRDGGCSLQFVTI